MKKHSNGTFLLGAVVGAVGACALAILSKRQVAQSVAKVPSTLKLVYFPVRARAECSRMLMAFGGIKFEEHSVKSYFGTGWRDGAKDHAKCAWGQLPILEVDGKPLSQSGSIVRYLAGISGCIPKDPVDAAYCDSVFELGQELASINPIVNVWRNEKFATEKTRFFETVLPPRLNKLVIALGNNDYFTGSEPAYCDFGVYHQLDLARLVEPTVFDKLPTIKAWMARVEALPGVREYIALRPECINIGTTPTLSPLPEHYK